MSLTSHLVYATDPIRMFLSEHFPNTRTFAKDLNRMLAKEETIRPDRRLPYPTLGIAIDYRIRYYFCITPAEKLVAWHGADKMVNFGELLLDIGPKQASIPVGEPLHTLDATLVQDFFFSLEEKLALLSPNERLLDRCEEEELNRYCFVLALFEEVHRSGLHITSPLNFQRSYSNHG